MGSTMSSTKNEIRTQVIVDCQLFQTADRDRGMGLYLYSLLAHVNPKVAIWKFVTNSKLPPLSRKDQVLLEKFNGEIVDAAFVVRDDGMEFKEAAQSNRDLVDSIVAPFLTDTKVHKTIFYIPAQFSSEIYPVFPTKGTANLMLFHDLIPFLYYRHYFHDHEGLARRDYAQRFQEVYKADLLVANSQTTADDLTVYFGIDPSRVLAILGAGASRSHLQPKAPAIAKNLGKFVLMPSGDDFRKNNLKAAAAFATLKTDVSLVITSNFSSESKRHISELCPNVVFTGSVTDEEYLWLLDHAQFVFFPTEYEGLGMPLLEAVDRGVAVACSNIPVFAEISQDGFHYFDPNSVTDMATVLKDLLSGVSIERTQYKSISKRFSWENTAKLFEKALISVTPATKKQKLAIFCPSPSSYSAVGKYAFEIHGELSRYYDIDYYAENGLTPFDPTRPNILEYAAGYYPASQFHEHKKQYDKVLYNIGNSEFHIETILESLRTSAYAIIHDTKLNGIYDYMTNHGFLTKERREFEDLLDDRFETEGSSCLVSIGSNQHGLICHSAFAKDTLTNIVRDTNIAYQLFHPIGVPTINLQRSDKTTVSFAGIISEDKGIRLVSEVSGLDNVAVKVFGFGVLGDSPLLQDMADNVKVMKDLTDKEFQDTLRMSDVLVNYRPNYHGETSRSTLEAMRYGVAVIVNSVGWYSELPDDVVVKVNGEFEVIDAIKMLIDNPQRRREIGDNARRFLASEYSYLSYAKQLTSVMED